MPIIKDLEGPYWTALRIYEKQLITDVLRQVGGDMRGAATVLGISHGMLYTRCRKLEVNVDDYRNGKVPGRAAPPRRLA